MTRFSCIPSDIRSFLAFLRPHFRYNHHLTFLWLTFTIMLNQRKGTVKNLSGITQNKSYDSFTRFLKAKYLQPRLLLKLTALKRLETLKDKAKHLHIVVDVTWVSKSGKHIWTSIGKSSKKERVEGIQLLVFCFEVSGQRIPFDFFIINNRKYGTRLCVNDQTMENLSQLELPRWVETVTLVADAAFAAKKVIHKLKEWGWNYVFRLPKTWKFENGESVKAFVNGLSRKDFKSGWYMTSHGKRRYCKYYLHRTELNDVGTVTLIYSYVGSNTDPNKRRIVVTNRALSHTEVLALYQRRWCIELLFKELKSEMGLGQMQLSSSLEQQFTAIAVTMIAYNTLFAIYDEPRMAAGKLKEEFHTRCMRQNLLSFVSKHLPEPVIDKFLEKFAV